MELERLGIGVALAWGALPWLVRLARRSRTGPPAEYYRVLLAALGIATLLIFVPLVRGSGVAPIPQASLAPSTVTFVAAVITTTARGWSLLPFGDATAAIGGMWLLLVAAGVVGSLLGHWRLQRAYRSAPLAPGHILERVRVIAAELGVRTPAIRVAAGSFAAFTYGAVSPIIVLSSSVCERGDDDLDFVLRHELCHVAHHDTRVMCLIDLAQRCFAGHPSLKQLATEIRVAREARTDEAAAGTRPLEYARFLLATAMQLHSERVRSSSLVSMADTALERRVELLINPRRSRLQRSMPTLAVVGLTLAGVVLLAPVSLSQPQAGAPAQLEVVEGLGQGLSNEVILATIHSHFPQLRECFDRVEDLASASLSMSFAIDRDGRALSGETIDMSEAVVSTAAFTQLAQCVDEVRRTMQFPVPDEGTVIVSFPLSFESEPCGH